MEENILEKFLLELNDKNIKYKTFVRFLNEYDGALLYIKSNYSMLLSNICSYDYIAVINFMFRDNNLKEIVQNNFLETMNNCPNKAYLCVILSIYLDGKNNEEKKEFLIPYFQTLVHSFKVPELRQLLEYKDLDSRFYNDLNEKITNNKQEYIKGNLLKKQIRGIDKEKDLDNLTSITTLMIDELLEEEHKNYVDISFSEGKYSLVFIIGDKVLSIGDRKEYDIPNHRRILQPLIRPNISSLTSSTYSLYTTMIDVSERVDTESEISEEELYLVYKELRDSNILWTDVKKENVGRLIKPNIVHFSKNLSNDNKAKGFTRRVDEENVLGVGEVVIIDKDFIYDLDKCSMNDIDFWNDLATCFENRYQLEKNERRGKKI